MRLQRKGVPQAERGQTDARGQSQRDGPPLQETRACLGAIHPRNDPQELRIVPARGASARL